ncbi:MAG: NapH/MauN family ferredoxin-type protein [Sulfurospirillaceae bacterium]|nr:NapH/MauN family ferredoxin-type protein [Sulfurospirillaceae bacterium]
MDKYKTRNTISKTSFWSTFWDTTKDGKKKLSIRAKRWMVVVAVHLLFFLSFAVDVQVLEGTLMGSRFLGFHLIDVFATLEVYLATYHMPINMVIGTVSIVLVYLIIGGRTYCSWICPYGLFSEIGEKFHDILVSKKIIKEREFDHRVKYIFWAIFLALAFTSGYLVFEVINVVGILSRFIAYGWSVALAWVLAVFLVEVFFARRAWCKYLCPIGATYGILGWVSATRIEWNDNCDHCMACHDVCFENHVLEITKKKYDEQRKEKGIKKEIVLNGDCTLCGRCIDVCHADALSYTFRLKSLV